MHAYTTNPYERRIVVAVLAIGGFILHQILEGPINRFSEWAGFPFSVPTAFAIFGALYWGFSRWAWRPLAWWGILSIRDLNGVWAGSLSSSYHNFEEELDFKLDIDQTWDKISISGSAGDSSSYSLSASFTNGRPGLRLDYLYQNEPDATAQEGMEIHKGAAMLSLSKDKNTLEGQYFNGRGRDNFGHMEVTRES